MESIPFQVDSLILSDFITEIWMQNKMDGVRKRSGIRASVLSAYSLHMHFSASYISR